MLSDPVGEDGRYGCQATVVGSAAELEPRLPCGLRWPGFSAASISLFSSAPNGLVTVYTARDSCLTGFGVTAYLTVRTGCIARRTERGVAARTVLRTSRLPSPTIHAPPRKTQLEPARAYREPSFC